MEFYSNHYNRLARRRYHKILKEVSLFRKYRYRNQLKAGSELDLTLPEEKSMSHFVEDMGVLFVSAWNSYSVSSIQLEIIIIMATITTVAL